MNEVKEYSPGNGRTDWNDSILQGVVRLAQKDSPTHCNQIAAYDEDS